MACQPGRSYIYRDPLGVVLIIGPWNYPLQLLLLPALGAIAAGNCVVLKPSELAPATSSLIARRLPEYLDAASVSVVEGGAAETTMLLAERFDHIFFTGGETVGRIVMQAAARHLTPVTLELGGKSPCIVDRHVDLEVAARRIVWGKFYNTGQTCVAPDYILAHKEIEERLLAKLKETVHEFFGDDPHSVADYGRIINERHYERLMGLLPGSGEIVTGGTGFPADRYIAPTILKNTSSEAPVMTGEIFGPILPVLKVQDVEHAIAFVNSRPKPLALYVFTSDPAVQAKVLDRTTSGGVTVNHTLLHLANPSLPFGGVGPSGMGAYHGRTTFETFSHRKSVLVKRTWLDPWFFYPPYTDAKKRWVRRII
jgi:aldehyde dehydrogenase (NAD+)